MVTAVVMVGEGRSGQGPDAWVQEARRAAALDLLFQLSRQPLIERLVLVSPYEEGLERAPVDEYVCSDPGPIHVGRELAALTDRFGISRLLYFGGGSAPLLKDATLSAIVEQLAGAEQLVVTNNQFASDWVGLIPATAIDDWLPRLPRDNMLGWVLSSEAGLPVQAQQANAASRLDIDTPIDLLALRLHPDTKENLRQALDAMRLPLANLDAALTVLATPASHVFIAGRLGPSVWLAINKATRSWLRVVSEERGMVSSGRQERGEARSVIAAHIEAVGMRNYFEMLAEWSDAAFIDTRVLLAHHGRWPDPSSRFASDLGRVEQIDDEWLRAFTEEAVRAPIPVVLGGHGLMSGAMLAFCEIMESRPAVQSV
ncbi:MAG TPA: hypothetical protein VK879_14285 [Candidatus Sulfomarinibacteraceae bacterium]|nr:hypothetical protein [Candidatus Sulfomarinibacteraceae bacterium]